jgi:hypothetical protein
MAFTENLLREHDPGFSGLSLPPHQGEGEGPFRAGARKGAPTGQKMEKAAPRFKGAAFAGNCKKARGAVSPS